MNLKQWGGREEALAFDDMPQGDYLWIHGFDVNRVETDPLGVPNGNPADSFLVTVCRGGEYERILIDGAKYGQGEKIICPWLQAHDITQLDAGWISHAHYDHFGGYADILKKVKVNTLYGAPVPLESMDPLSLDVWGKVMAAVGESNTPFVSAHRDKLISVPSWMQVLDAPPAAADPWWQGEDGMSRKDFNQNDCNIILKLTFGQFTALFTGDCSDYHAARLLASPVMHNMRNMFCLKAAHHGGEQSATSYFIRQVNAKLVMATCNHVVTNWRPDFVTNLATFTANGGHLLRGDHALGMGVVTDGAEAWAYEQRPDGTLWRWFRL